jgi:hypothetical protein
MFRIAKNAAAALALTGLVLSQPAMAVRSSDSLPAQGAKVSGAIRLGTPVNKSEELAGVPAVGLIIAGLVVIAAIVIVAKDNKDKNKSPG